MTKNIEALQQSATQRSFTPGMEVRFKGGMGIVAPKQQGRPPKDSKGKVPVQIRGEIKWFKPEDLTPADAQPPEPEVKAVEPTPIHPPLEVSPEQRYLLLNALTSDWQGDLKICTDIDYHSAHLINRHLKVLEEEGLCESCIRTDGYMYMWIVTEAGVTARTELAKTVIIQQDPWRTSDIFTVTLQDGCKVEVIFEPDKKDGQTNHFDFKGLVSDTGYRSYFFTLKDAEDFKTPQAYALYCAETFRKEYLKEHPPVIEVGDWVIPELLIDQAKKRITERNKNQIYGRVEKIKRKTATIYYANGRIQEESLSNLYKFEDLFLRAIEEIEKGKLPSEEELAALTPVERNLEIELARLTPEVRERIESRTSEIQSLKRGVVADLVKIGLRLIEQKDDLQDGAWLNWLELNGWEGSDGQRDAQYLMSVGETFGHLDPNTCSYLDYSSLKLLASKSVDKDPSLLEVRSQFIAQAKQGIPVRHKDVKTALDKLRIPTLKPAHKAANGSNQGYSSGELKTGNANAQEVAKRDEALNQYATELGVKNKAQPLPTLPRTSPPAEVDDRPFAPGMSSNGNGNGNGHYTTLEIVPESEEDSGEISYAKLVESMTQEQAIDFLVTVVKKFGPRIFEAVREQFKARA